MASVLGENVGDSRSTWTAVFVVTGSPSNGDELCDSGGERRSWWPASERWSPVSLTELMKVDDQFSLNYVFTIPHKKPLHTRVN